MNKYSLGFCFKGSRTYIQGSDIFDKTLDALNDNFNAENITKIKYSARKILHKNADLYITDKSEKSNFNTINSTATTMPKHIKPLLESNDLDDRDIDKYVLHQGSKFIVGTITKRSKIDSTKVPFDMAEYENSISLSVPIILEKEIQGLDNTKILIAGFGVGLSWGSAIIEKRN